MRSGRGLEASLSMHICEEGEGREGSERASGSWRRTTRRQVWAPSAEVAVTAVVASRHRTSVSSAGSSRG